MSVPFHLSFLLLLAVASAASADIVVEDRPLSSAPVIRAPVSTAASPAATPAIKNEAGVAPVREGGGNNWELYTQVQQLQQEIEQMRGSMEEQSHQIEKLQNDLRIRYTDLDQRLSAQQEQFRQAVPIGTTAAGAGNETTAPSATIEEEKKAYLAAYETFRAGGPDKAIPPMLAFVKRYPNSSFTPNAYYWLGEFYLNASTPDPVSARKHFDTVLAKYADSAKAPAALYKIGSILDLQGKPQDAKKKMQELLMKYPGSPETALANSYIQALEAAQAQPAPKPAIKKPSAKKM